MCTSVCIQTFTYLIVAMYEEKCIIVCIPSMDLFLCGYVYVKPYHFCFLPSRKTRCHLIVLYFHVECLCPSVKSSWTKLVPSLGAV